MTSAGNTYDDAYDASGNLLDENTERPHEWDWGGQMRRDIHREEGPVLHFLGDIWEAAFWETR